MNDELKKTCDNCSHVDVCKFYEKIRITANGNKNNSGCYAMFAYSEQNNIIRMFSAYCAEKCKHWMENENC